MLSIMVFCVMVWTFPLYALAQTPQTTLNKSAPLARGLVNFWVSMPNFIGGNSYYDLMGGPPLVLTNMAKNSTTSGWAMPTRRGSKAEIRFDGSDDVLATPVNSAIFPPFYSVTLWMKATGAFAGDYSLLWEAFGGAGNLFVTPAGKLAIYIGSAVIDPAPTTLSQQVWYHITLTVDAALARLYIDARPEASTTSPGAASTTTFYHTFGNKLAAANRFTGSMDDLKFYDRALSPQEVRILMDQSQLGNPQLLPDPYTIRAQQPLGFVAAVVATIKSRFFYFMGR